MTIHIGPASGGAPLATQLYAYSPYPSPLTIPPAGGFINVLSTIDTIDSSYIPFPDGGDLIEFDLAANDILIKADCRLSVILLVSWDSQPAEGSHLGVRLRTSNAPERYWWTIGFPGNGAEFPQDQAIYEFPSFIYLEGDRLPLHITSQGSPGDIEISYVDLTVTATAITT